MWTVSHIPNIKVGVAYEQSWPTAIPDHALHRNFCYCATWFRHALAIFMMLEVKIIADPLYCVVENSSRAAVIRKIQNMKILKFKT